MIVRKEDESHDCMALCATTCLGKINKHLNKVNRIIP